VAQPQEGEVVPFRLDNGRRAKVQFVTFARMPSLIYKAAKAQGTVSNTRYIQEAVCEKLARDLDLDLDGLLNELPPPRGAASVLRHGTVPHRGREFVIEQVR
jgi:hypothetical protein